MGAAPLRISDLLLDLRNPRMKGATNQREALEQMIADQGDKLIVLAEDIVVAGMCPIDRILVMRSLEDASKFTVLEGNRRVAALKMLANSAVLTGIHVPSKIKKKFEAISRGFKRTQVEPLDAYEVASREEGNRWIELRHTGANNGRGVVDWKGYETARFRGSNSPALQVLDFVRAHGQFTDKELSALETGFPVTTLDRLVRTPAVREKIGLFLNGGVVQAIVSGPQVIKPLRKIVLDLATKKVNVSRLKSKDQQVAYVNGFSDDDTVDLSDQLDPKPLAGISDADFKSSRKKRTPRPSSERNTVAPKTLRLAISDDRIQRIYWELQHLKVDDFPNAAAVLIRVFLEMSVDHFLTKHSISLYETTKSGHTNEKKLNTKVKDAVDKLVSGGAKAKDFISVTTGIDKASSPLYTGLLNAYVHNQYLTPKGRELVSTWSDAQPFFERMWA